MTSKEEPIHYNHNGILTKELTEQDNRRLEQDSKKLEETILGKAFLRLLDDKQKQINVLKTDLVKTNESINKVERNMRYMVYIAGGVAACVLFKKIGPIPTMFNP